MNIDGEILDAEFQVEPTPVAEEASPLADTEPTPAEAAQEFEPEASEAPEAESIRRIAKAERLAAIRRREWEDAKEVCKNLKALFEASMDELCKVIKRETESLPLFESQAVAEAAGPVEPEDENEMLTVEDQSWQEVPLADVLSGLPPSIVSALNESGLKSVGELAGASKNPQFKLTDIPGIGPAKAEKMEAALEAFWKRRAEAANVPEGDAELDAAADDNGEEG